MIHYDNVEASEFVTRLAKRLADDALQAVAGNGAAAMFARNRESESRLTVAVSSVEDRKHRVAAAFCFVEYAAEGTRIGQAAAPSETAVDGRACCRTFFRLMPGREFISASAKAVPGLLRGDV